jgi:hypothetical protein
VVPTALWRSAAPDFGAAEVEIRLPIVLPIGRSRAIDVALIVAHLLAGLGLTPLPLPVPAKVAVWTVLALSLARLLLGRRQTYPLSLKLEVSGQLSMLAKDGSLTPCRVDAASTVLPWLIVLRLNMDGAIQSLVLPVDALGAEGHRHLRTWLRWRASVSGA